MGEQPLGGVRVASVAGIDDVGLGTAHAVEVLRDQVRRAAGLDAAIVKSSVRINDFSAFFAVHRSIARVFFNGGAAEAAFRRHVLPGLQGADFQLIRLPSTSPAHAASSYADKLAAWSAIIAPPK